MTDQHVLLMATRRPRPDGPAEAEPVLIAVSQNGTVEVILEDGTSFEFDAVELSTAIVRDLDDHISAAA